MDQVFSVLSNKVYFVSLLWMKCSLYYQTRYLLSVCYEPSVLCTIKQGIFCQFVMYEVFSVLSNKVSFVSLLWTKCSLYYQTRYLLSVCYGPSVLCTIKQGIFCQFVMDQVFSVLSNKVSFVSLLWTKCSLYYQT